MVFGENERGQCGINRLENQFIPTAIRNFKNIKSVHCGANHSFLLSKTGNVYATGDNTVGQVENSKPNPNFFTL